MTDLETARSDLGRALNSGDSEAIDAALNAALEAVAQTEVTPETTASIDETAWLLRNQLKFDALATFSDAALQSGHSGPIWGQLVQGLIEQDGYTAAKSVAQSALDRNDLSPEERQSLLGQTARISKDLYMDRGDESNLLTAIALYERGVLEGGDLLWLGLNAHSLSHLARRKGITVEPLDIPPETVLLESATSLAAASDDTWAVAAMVEASLLVGLPAPVDAIAHRLDGAPPFLHASLRRQLQEVWELPDSHPAIVTLAEFVLRSGGGDDIMLPEASDGYEKMFGTEWPVPIATYSQGLQAASSVCHLLVGTSFPAGTGFVLDGDQLHPDLAGRLVVVTNEHVVPSLDRDGLRAEEITASFDAHDFDPVGGFRAVWWSDRRDLDVTVLMSDYLDEQPLKSLTTGTRLPTVRDGSYVYVVGHPGGAGLQLSIRGNSLIDHDEVRIHYKAPTSRGSSGSPVFDHEWNLIGVHHRGSSKLGALNGRDGYYDGNEGTSILALRQQLADRPPSL